MRSEEQRAQGNPGGGQSNPGRGRGSPGGRQGNPGGGDQGNQVAVKATRPR